MKSRKTATAALWDAYQFQSTTHYVTKVEKTQFVSVSIYIHHRHHIYITWFTGSITWFTGLPYLHHMIHRITIYASHDSQDQSHDSQHHHIYFYTISHSSVDRVTDPHMRFNVTDNNIWCDTNSLLLLLLLLLLLYLDYMIHNDHHIYIKRFKKTVRYDMLAKSKARELTEVCATN